MGYFQCSPSALFWHFSWKVPMKLNKRTVAVAALSVSLVAPTISPVSQAAENGLVCNGNSDPGTDFDTKPLGVHGEEHLRPACGLNPEQIEKVEQDEINEPAKESGYENPNNNAVSLHSNAFANKESDESSSVQRALVDVEEVFAGDRTVNGRVLLPAGNAEQKIKAVFLPRFFPQEIVVRRSDADNAQWVPFSITVHSSIDLEEGNQVLVGLVPSAAETQKAVTVKAKNTAPTEKPDVNPIPPSPNPNPGSAGDQAGTNPKLPGTEGNGYLKCENKFQKGQDFDGIPSVVVVKHLQQNCGLSDDEIRKLNEEDLRKVAEELKEPADKVSLSLVRAVLTVKTGAPVPGAQPERKPAPTRITEKDRRDALQKLAAASAINPEQRKAFAKDIAETSDAERLKSIAQAIDAENANPIAKLAPKASVKPQAPKKNNELNNEDPTKKPNPNQESGKLDFEDNEVFSPNQKEWTAKDFVNPFKQHEKNQAGQELQETKRAASAAIDGIQQLSNEHKAAYKAVIASATSVEQVELLVHGALETAEDAGGNDKPSGLFGIDENPLYSPNAKQWTSEDFLNSFKQHEKNEAAKVVAEAMLKETKRKAHAAIDGVKGLTEKQRSDYKGQIDGANNQEAVQRIVEVAQKSNVNDTGEAAENQPPKNPGNSGGADNGSSAGEHTTTPSSSASKAKVIDAIAAGFGALGLAIGGILGVVNHLGGLNAIQAKVIDMLTRIGIRF